MQKITELQKSKSSTSLDHILMLGAAGALGRKLTPYFEYVTKKYKTKIYAADVISESDFKSKTKFDGFEGFFNIRCSSDKEKLFNLGRTNPFDLCYDATWPDARIFNLVRWSSVSKNFITTKPLASVNQFETLRALVSATSDDPGVKHSETHSFLEGAPAYEDVVAKLWGHEHYINKPSIELNLANLSKLHSQFGWFSRISIMITEQRNVNHPDERERIRALDEGMIPDLCSHAVMIIQRLAPVGLVWQDGAGNSIKRLWRHIVPTACVQAKMKNAICQGDTACVVEYKVSESISLVNEQGATIGRPQSNTFYVLVFCGKGFRAETYTERDLKSIEIAFQGQGASTGIVDIETNQVNQMLESVLGQGLHDPDLCSHRGINLPMCKLVDRWPEFSSGGPVRKELLQSVDLLFDNMKLLKETMGLNKRGNLPAYDDKGELVHQFLNTHVNAGNGFQFFGQPGSGWPRTDSPMHLMVGKPPEKKVD